MAPLDQIDQIQDLVAEIDGVLRNDDRPWILGGRVRQRQRQTLEHLRSALTRLGGDLRQQATTPIANLANLSDPATSGQPPRLKASAISYGAAQTAIDTFTQDLQTLRTTLVQSLQTEVTTLQEQRDQLRREIQEMQRQAPGQTLLSEGMMQAFLQQLMLQLQERLSQQVQQSMAQQLATGQPLAIPSGVASSDITTLAPIDQAQLQFAQIQHLHDQSETLVRQVDSTLTVFAQTLEQNMRTYQQALEKGLEKMHSMGAQGEVLFAEFVNRLADRLEAQASAYFLANEGLANEGSANEAQLTSGQVQPTLSQAGGQAGSYSGDAAIAPTSPKAFNVELGNLDLGPGFTPPPIPVPTPAPLETDLGPVAMDLTDGTATPVLPQTDALTEVNWQSVAPTQPEPALDVAARVRPADLVAAEPVAIAPPEPAASPTPQPTPDPVQTEALSPATRSRSVAEAAWVPTNELDAFYADLMMLTGGMSVADRLVTSPMPEAPIGRNAPIGTDPIANAPRPTHESPEIAPAKRGSVDQQPIAQPPAPINQANVVQSLTELFGDSRSAPGHTSETDRNAEELDQADLDNGLFAQYSVAGPDDAQKKNLI